MKTQLFLGPINHQYYQLALEAEQSDPRIISPVARDFLLREWEYSRSGNVWVRRPEDESYEQIAGEEVELVVRPNIWITAYLVTREYGGPEEGGWWYDEGQVLTSLECDPDAVDAIEQRLKEEYAHLHDPPMYSVNSSGEVRFSRDDWPGVNYPAVRPHYE